MKCHLNVEIQLVIILAVTPSTYLQQFRIQATYVGFDWPEIDDVLFALALVIQVSRQLNLTLGSIDWGTSIIRIVIAV